MLVNITIIITKSHSDFCRVKDNKKILLDIKILLSL